MKLFTSSFLFLFFIQAAGYAQTPQVPSSIEIADVKLKITSGARAKIQKDVNAIRASERYFQVKLDLVNLYFPIIERVLKEEGVPEDIKYLSIQESSLQSDAVSSAKAVGYWQFKDFTAREVGLRVDGKVDERKNIVAATSGAAKYFKRNNMFFDHWIYSVNAYMTGPGGAKKYVDKSNFGTGKLTVTENTHWYVLRFIAHVIAYKDEIGGPHSEGLKLVEYTKGANKDLGQIARQFNVDADLVKEYNKWLSHGKVPDDKVYTVIIPVTGKIPNVEDNNPAPLARNIKEPEPVKYPEKLTETIGSKKAILVKINGLEAVMAGENDNLASLSLKTDVSVRRLEKYNDLKPGQEITGGEIYYTEKKKNRSPIRYHVAQPDESLWDISQKYGVKLKKLARKNRTDMYGKIKAGRVVWLRKKRPKKTPVEYHRIQKTKPVLPKREPAKETPISEPIEPVVKEVEKKAEPVKETEKSIPEKTEPEPVIIYKYHEVKPGESLWKIAGLYGISIEEIRNWNELNAHSSLHPGQKLRLRKDKINEIVVKKDEEQLAETTNETVATSHIVAAGESLWTISRKYNISVGELAKWNQLDENKSLTIGQELSLNPEAEKGTSNPSPAHGSIHEVQAGESLWTISRKYNLTVEELAKWNNLNVSAGLKPGQQLTLQEGERKNPEYVTYIVRGGDSLYKIAKQYNTTVEEIMDLNKLSSSALSVGDELKVKRN